MLNFQNKGAAFKRDLMADVQEMMFRKLSSLSAALRIVDVPVVLGTKGTVLAVGAHVFLRLGLNGEATVLTWSLAATVAAVAHTGALTVDVQTGATLATVASICGTGKPALAAQSELADQLPTNWTSTTIADPFWVLVTVTATDGTLEVAGLTLRVAVSPR